MTQPGFFSPRNRGFTLVEIAVVIVILALLLAMLLGISSTMLAQQRREATRARLIAVETAIALYVSQYKRLPCPADGSMAPTNSEAGKEQSSGTGTLRVCNLGGVANSQTNGVLPWRSLGLTEADITDGWGTRLTYRAAPEFVWDGSMNMTACDPAGGVDVSPPDVTYGYCNPLCVNPPPPSFNPANCTSSYNVSTSRGLTVKNLAGTDIMIPAAQTGAAYVVISHGENRAGGYDNQSIVQAAVGPPSGTEEAKNAANLPLQAYYVDDFPSYLENTSHFDDFVVRPTVLGVAAKAQLAPRAH